MDYATRLKKLSKLLASANIDAVIYGTGANFQYFSGLQVEWQRDKEPERPGCLFLLRQGETPLVLLAEGCADLMTTAPVQIERIESPAELGTLLVEKLQGCRSVGTSTAAYAYIGQLLGDALPNLTCSDAEALGEQIRIIKTPEEIALLRRSAALIDQVMTQVVTHIKPGITQLQLQTMVTEAGKALGAQGVSFPATAGFVKSGVRVVGEVDPNDNPFVYPKEEPLVPATSIAFDFGFILDGYCSDFGRSFYCGPAPEHIANAYKALQDAHCHLISRMKPGLKIGEMFNIIEAFLDGRGFGDRLRARLPHGNLGHHIGVDLHEKPWLRPGCDVVLQPGMVMCLEPKLWLPGEYYIRVEDMVLITEEGAESLTVFDRRLFELPLA